MRVEGAVEADGEVGDTASLLLADNLDQVSKAVST
jgi:hypothetical protein